MDGAFRFEVGVFTGSFVPTLYNTEQWADNWVPAKGVAYSATNRFFTGQFSVVNNTAPFTVGKPAYIRGFRGDASMANGYFSARRHGRGRRRIRSIRMVSTGVRRMDDVVLGNVNASGSPFLMRAVAVPLGDADGDGVADLWDLANGTVPNLAMYLGADLA